MQVVNTIAGLYKVISELLAGRTSSVIAIDGEDGAGKTWLAQEISQEFSMSVVSIDDCLTKNCGAYCAFVNIEKLRNMVENVGNSKLILEGLCAIYFFKKLKLKYDVLVYVKKVQYGNWVNEDMYGSTDDHDDIIERQTKIINKFARISCPTDGDTSLGGMYEDLIRYHSKYKPHLLADIIFEKDIRGDT